MPLASSSWADTLFVLTRLTICCGPTPARANWRPSCTRPASRASKLRSDWATKIALTATQSRASTTASPAMTPRATRVRTDPARRPLPIMSEVRSPAVRSPAVRSRDPEPVTAPTHRVQHPGPTAGLELAPKRGDVHLHHIVVEPVVTPHRGQDLGLAH